MDSPETNGGRKGIHIYVCRFLFTFLFALIVSFLFSFVGGLVAVSIGKFSASSPVSFVSQCKIVSSGVDLKTTKVCELAFLNYNAKHVFYPMEKRKFRCRYDYYWASFFKVEYRETSGRTRYAMAEAPNEALPLHCRPSFTTVWLTKDKFKVNRTYDCRYTSTNSKMDIFPDDLFNCRAEDPSVLEMIQRYSILFANALDSLLSNIGSKKSIFQGAATGLICGMLSSVVLINFVRLLQVTKLKVETKWISWKSRIAFYATHLRRVCMLVAYLSAMGWLTVRYGKMLGLSELFSQLLVSARRPER